MKTLVIGANAATKNLGHHIALARMRHGDLVDQVSKGSPLSVYDNLSAYDNLVITVGSAKVHPIHEQNQEEIQQEVTNNLVLPLGWVASFLDAKRRVAKEWKPTNRPKVVVLGSMAHRKVLTGMSVYSAAKAGLDQFVKSAAFEAHEYADVFCVHPASVANTPMAEDIVAQTMLSKKYTESEARQHWKAGNLSSERTVKPHDIVHTVNFLLQPASTRLSGTSIEVAGGQR